MPDPNAASQGNACTSVDVENNVDILTCQVNEAQLQQQQQLYLENGPSSTLLNVSVASLDNSFAISRSFPIASLPLSLQCSRAQDCFDGNICTMDSCVAGNCVSEIVNTSCASIPASIRENVAPYTYHTFYLSNTTSQHNSFVLFMLERGTGSKIAASSSTAEYAPSEIVPLNFTFVYFGNLLNTLSLNCNGVISLPPQLGWQSAPSNSVRSFFAVVFAS
jgi:hypothetical protein